MTFQRALNDLDFFRQYKLEKKKILACMYVSLLYMKYMQKEIIRGGQALLDYAS